MKFTRLMTMTTLLATWSLQGTAAPADSTQLFIRDMNQFLEQVRQQFPEMPGLALAVVRGDEPVLVRGVGMADREAGVPAGPDVLYYIASSTKSFTGLAAALLAERGRLDLDAPLTRYFPKINFPPEVGAGQVTVRQLLSHTSGLQNDALVFRSAYTGDSKHDTLMKVLEKYTTSDGKRGQYDYTNLGYNIFSLLLEEQFGRPWQDQLRDLVFEPLGMDRTTAYASLPRREGWSVAAPYSAYGENGTVRLPLEKQDNTMHAAGGLLATADDLARWLIAQLNEGRIDGRQVFPAAAIRETHAGIAPTTRDIGPFPDGEYGLGWHISKYEGQRVLYHFGGFAGFRAHVSFLPGAGLGIAVMSNESVTGSQLPDLLATFAYDWWLGKPDVLNTYTARLGELRAQLDQRLSKVAADRTERAKRTWQLLQPLDAYAGRYYNEQFGKVEVSIDPDAGAPVVRAGNMHAVATPFTQPNTIRVELVPFSGEVVRFEADGAGKIERLVYDGEVFVREE